MIFDHSLFIFRRDLRLKDNTALTAACQQSRRVIPCFIFDPRQVGKHNPFKSTHALQFMIESLQDLQEQLQKKGSDLLLFYDEPEKIVARLIQQYAIQAVFVNVDYTPFSQERDDALAKLCEPRVKFCSYDDVLLNPPHTIIKADHSHYSVFTPYWKNAKAHPVALPRALTLKTLGTYKTSPFLYEKIYPHKNPQQNAGGRKHALKILQNLRQFQNYAKTHDIPAQNTTRLSAHLKFGTVSIRETYHAMQNHLGPDHLLLRQLYWRDFYTQIAYYAPFVFGHPYQKKYEKLLWNEDENAFKRWCEGNTGFPIVDAGMRELNTSGFMHNRVRMIVASFLTKDLHIDWRWGERYFAQQLSDYDPAVNNGNWQWCASTGCDPQPYFRVFNPWLQQAKFDPDCAYIKHWVPELVRQDTQQIHQGLSIKGYPKPMVDHAKESSLAKTMFIAIKNR